MHINVFTIDNCQWCEKTKVLLDSLGVSWNSKRIPDDEKVQFLDEFTAIYGGDRSFPRVLRMDIEEGSFALVATLVGGFDQTLNEVLNGRI